MDARRLLSTESDHGIVLRVARVHNNRKVQFRGELHEFNECLPLVLSLLGILHPVIVKSHLANSYNLVSTLPYESNTSAHHLRTCPRGVKAERHPHKTGKPFHQVNRPWIELWFNGADHNADNPSLLGPFHYLRSRVEKRWHLEMAMCIKEFHGRFLGAVASTRKVEKVSAPPAS